MGQQGGGGKLLGFFLPRGSKFARKGRGHWYLEKGLVLGSVVAMVMACLDTLLPSTVKLERTVLKST